MKPSLRSVESDPAPVPAVLVLAAGRLRDRGRLDLPAALPVADPPIDAILATVLAQNAALIWLGGGEPTLRADLPALLSAVRAVLAEDRLLGLWSDGLALASPAVVAMLQSHGLDRVRIPWHAARSDAHDWLVRRPGACQRVARALRVCATAGLAVEIEITLTRPTMDLLPETVSAAMALGVESIVVRRLQGRGAAAQGFVSLSPRFGLTEPLLERAASIAERGGVSLCFDGFPACALGSARSRLVARCPVRAPTAALQAIAIELAANPTVQACPECPAGNPGADPACAGAPRDYVQVFGRAELDDRCSRPRTRAQGVPPVDGEGPPGTPPPPRAGRAPATRLAFSIRQAALPSLHGDPLAGVPPQPQLPRRTIAFPADRSSRFLRQQLCRLAQDGPAVLRIDDAFSLAHPAALGLLRECVRLGFAGVELSGPLWPLHDISDREIIGLKGLTLVSGWVHGTDARTQELLARLARLIRVKTQVVRVPAPVDAG
ncbi:MAG: hypothetical protein GXP62_21105 [Oligoflexia bacterium]|nr:hypothetical protein [Oligoflexia bacterium]